MASRQKINGLLISPLDFLPLVVQFLLQAT
jgi:hypothetical protein